MFRRGNPEHFLWKTLLLKGFGMGKKKSLWLTALVISAVPALFGCGKRPDLFLSSSIVSEDLSAGTKDTESGNSEEEKETAAGESRESVSEQDSGTVFSEADSEESVKTDVSENSEESSDGGSEESDSEADTSAVEAAADMFTLWSPETDKVPEGEEVADDYFSDALFIGNSRMEGFVLYSGLKLHAMTGVGLTVASAYTEPLFGGGEEKKTLIDALKDAGGYSKFYLLFGLNELGWSSYRTFTDDYGGIIDAILAANPDAVVYLESILPLTAEKSSESEWLNNENVNRFNQMIWQLAKEKGASVAYLDTAHAVAGEDGCLPKEASFDGVHLNKESCLALLSYLKTHTV